MSKEKFINGDFKTITLMGMSGAGKSHLGSLLNTTDNWYHFSVDYLIGKYYIADHIPDAHTITKSDISAISRFMGMLGDPIKGGYPYTIIKRNQRLYHDAEVLATQALPIFIRTAMAEGMPGLINDTTGSLCDLNYPELPEIISEHSLIVYIEATDEERERIFQRAIKAPKPLFYPADFLDEHVQEFITHANLKDDRDIDPEAFFTWIFPKLFDQRLPKYKAIADKYGVTVSSADVKKVENAQDLVNLVKQAL